MRTVMLILATLFCLGGVATSALGPFILNGHIFGFKNETKQSYSEVLQNLIDQKEELKKSVLFDDSMIVSN